LQNPAPSIGSIRLSGRVDPAGNVWVMNNWQDTDSCFGTPPEPLSTLCGGQGVVIFYGMAKPVRAPQIGPAQAP
jgi:hypothetical protein